MPLTRVQYKPFSSDLTFLTFDLNLSSKLSGLQPLSYLELIRELNKLHLILVATFYDKQFWTEFFAQKITLWPLLSLNLGQDWVKVTQNVIDWSVNDVEPLHKI